MASNTQAIVAKAQDVLNKSMKVPGEEQFAPTATSKAPYSLARAVRKTTGGSGVDYNPFHTVKAVVNTVKSNPGKDIAGGIQGIKSQLAGAKP